ncbi:hypothetical protein L7F22_047589 [Adiantum nelumboides]|nr:hypothetical protein [Adiantum nelumboides]
MSTVDKMLIKGIRSFSPENTHVITFYKPLTLIVGPNGAGKTTIIESLKHACTGELPPNARSGQSFVHDPKVAGETEVKGQIKLRFKTAAGKDVVCIRSFQLTQKGTKLEYKAIESVLQTIDPLSGEKVCLSYRCADMDREVPALMGVSKAILENVIFVHQDEANWPLADGATLKKKFDDIFSATKSGRGGFSTMPLRVEMRFLGMGLSDLGECLAVAVRLPGFWAFVAEIWEESWSSLSEGETPPDGSRPCSWSDPLPLFSKGSTPLSLPLNYTVG